MSNNTSNKSGGIGFVGLLTIVFITLKLCGVINWTWLWVLSPIWISIALVFGILLFVGIIALLVHLFKKPETPEQKAARLCRELSSRLARR